MREHTMNTNSNNVLGSAVETPEALNSQAFALVEALRPFQALLSQRDVWHLQHLSQHCASKEAGIYPLLTHLARAKLEDASTIDDLENLEGIASMDCCLAFSINEKLPVSRTLFLDGFADDQGGVPLKSLLGVTLLGMRIGQKSNLLRADGTKEKLRLVDVLWRRGQSSKRTR